MGAGESVGHGGGVGAFDGGGDVGEGAFELWSGYGDALDGVDEQAEGLGCGAGAGVEWCDGLVESGEDAGEACSEDDCLLEVAEVGDEVGQTLGEFAERPLRALADLGHGGLGGALEHLEVALEVVGLVGRLLCGEATVGDGLGPVFDTLFTSVHNIGGATCCIAAEDGGHRIMPLLFGQRAYLFFELTGEIRHADEFFRRVINADTKLVHFRLSF